MPEPVALETDLGIDAKLNVLTPGVPTIDQIEELARNTQDQQREYGVSSYSVKDGQRYFRLIRSSGTKINEPEIPREIKGKVDAGIFIHCHPIFPGEEVESGKSLHVLPSGYNAEHGDIASNLWERKIAGYLNIASKYGLTMNIGVEGLTREEHITRTLKARAKADDTANESVWKILSGKKGGTSFNESEFPQAVTNKFSLDGDVILLSNSERFIGTRYFLHLSWEKLKELESIYGGIDNLFFGDGLDTLTKHLEITVPHERNIAKAARKIYALPKNREV